LDERGRGCPQWARKWVGDVGPHRIWSTSPAAWRNGGVTAGGGGRGGDGIGSYDSDTMLQYDDQMHVLSGLGLHIQGPNGPKAYIVQNIYILL
jgi:hypothetical protein